MDGTKLISGVKVGGGEAPVQPIWIGKLTPRVGLDAFPTNSLIGMSLYRVGPGGSRIDRELKAATGKQYEALFVKALRRHLSAGTRILLEINQLLSPHLFGQIEALPNIFSIYFVTPRQRFTFTAPGGRATRACPKERAVDAQWHQCRTKLQQFPKTFYADIGSILLHGMRMQCLAISLGGISGYDRGQIYGLVRSPRRLTPTAISEALIWARLLSSRLRKETRKRQVVFGPETSMTTKGRPHQFIRSRCNRKVSQLHDQRQVELWQRDTSYAPSRRALGKNDAPLNVIEIFSGAGGMGLGFLMANEFRERYRIIASAEINPVYVKTLQRNHEYIKSRQLYGSTTVACNPEPMDLTNPSVRATLARIGRDAGNTDILIGGPPCQGFSSANRNNGHSTNPNNELVGSFLSCVKILRPRVLVLENVQGILWTAGWNKTGGTGCAADHVLAALRRLGYIPFPKLLDASWYGAPQARNRLFVVGFRRDLGYSETSFGAWGPFPKPLYGPGTAMPYVTVQDAIGDLPPVENGSSSKETRHIIKKRRPSEPFLAEMQYGSPQRLLWDHTTSKHADYVIERFKRIAPGENWESVRSLLTNYSNVERTHSNLYRRLEWNRPAVTIGHYRKNLLIHPEQHRGLSLREASRLQTFPDWFRFCGDTSMGFSGISHQQQQLANAVCPLLTKQLAKHLLTL
jgi:DNA-cytosine methyltransferase